MKQRIPLFRLLLIGIFSIFLLFSPVTGKDNITTPMEQFGHKIGDDYWLATYSQLTEYWKKLAQESDRLVLEKIGKTEEGRTMIMAIITSPENHQKLSRYKEISQKLALAKGLTDEKARALAEEGKAVVWIDGGLHATEVAGAQQELELVYQMVSREDPETQRILDNVILLTLITNPDGMELVGNWYMRKDDPKERSTRWLPRLYQKYVGHDNNRDFYMVTQSETKAINNILYREWFPQIVYNQHQTGPSGCVLFAPPFRDPHSFNFDPLLVLGITTVGNAMHSRFVAEGKPGSTMREGAWYQTWWNGCLRGTPYFHNMIGILTEIIGHPNPMKIPFRPEKLLSDGDYPYPIAPQKWHFRQTIEYSITADRAILDTASKLKEDFLFNIYRMGKNSIQRGRKDHWTLNPTRIEAVKKAIQKEEAKKVGSGRSRGYPPKYYDKVLHDPDYRDPRGYILSSGQPDFLTACKFANTLIKNGITIHRAVESFEVQEKSYPQGSLIIKCDQAFRPHILDMLEPQFYPEEAGTPYDSAGYTLALQMGVKFDRILEGFDGPFKEIQGLITPPSGKVINPDAPGFLLSHQTNDSFIALNHLLKKGENVFWIKTPLTVKDQSFPEGTIYIPAQSSTVSRLKEIARETGLDFIGTNRKLQGSAYKLEPVHIGLWDEYGGSMSSGWIRWMFDEYDFDYEVVYPPTLDTGNLNKKFDVLVFPDGSIPRVSQESRRSRWQSMPDPQDIPAKYREQLGEVTVEKTIPNLHRFLKNGGTILTIGSATNLAYHLDLPVENALAEKTPKGELKPFSRKKFFIPGSIMEVKVNNKLPLAYGIPEKVNVYFDRSPVFKLLPEASFQGVHPVAWFDSEKTLKSGWARGQQLLEGRVSVFEANLGEGKLFAFGPEITFRAQPHGTFKFLFNGIYCGGLHSVDF